MRYILLVLFNYVLVYSSLSQDQALATQLIEEDFAYLIKSLADINLELSLATDRDLLDELRDAKNLLIKDYTQGPFKIFTSTSSEVVLGSNKTTIKSYLKNLKINQAIQTDISIKEVAKLKNGFNITFQIKGIMPNQQLLLAQLSSKGDDIYIHSIKDKTISKAKRNIQEVAHKSPKREVEPPVIVLKTAAIVEDQIIVQGEVSSHSLHNGSLSINDNYYDRRKINIDVNGAFTFALNHDDQSVKNLDIKYLYDDKFTVTRKNFVIAEKTLLLSSLPASKVSTDSHEVAGIDE